MKVYFLVEGKTERKLYPGWLKHLIPTLTPMSNPAEQTDNGYFLISGGGFPHLLDKRLVHSAEDISDAGDYDYFVLALDADEVSVEYRIDEVNNRIAAENLSFGNCRVRLVIQNRCVETWLLGNRRVFSRNPTDEKLAKCTRFYNVFRDDPEEMTKPNDFEESYSVFHYQYLKAMLAQRHMRYSKKNPGEAVKASYLDSLKERLAETPGHLATLRTFLQLCDEISDHM